MDFSHGGGQWLDSLFLPDSGVVCTFASEWRPTLSNLWAPEVSTMHVRRSTLADELAARPKSPVGEQPPEEIQVSAAFAREAIRLADLTEQVRATGDQLGATALSTGLARPPLARDFVGLPAK